MKKIFFTHSINRILLLPLLVGLAACSNNSEDAKYVFPDSYLGIMTDLLTEADYWQDTPAILAAGLGFTDINGVPGLGAEGQTLAESKALARSVGAGWHDVNSSVDPASINIRAYTSAISLDNMTSLYGYPSPSGDGLPMEFSHPVLASSVQREDIAVTLNNGDVITPLNISVTPNREYNERSTLVINGNFGNRLDPSEEGAIYPVRFVIVDEMMLVTQYGLYDAHGLTYGDGFTPLTAYQIGKGPRLCAAKLTPASAGLGGESSSPMDDLVTLYGADAEYRLRILTTGGFSPDGVRSMYPTEFQRYFRVGVAPTGIASTDYDNLIWLEQTGVDYNISGYGKIKVLGLADLGGLQAVYDDSYLDDHDNQIDIVLNGDKTAIERIVIVHIPASGNYDPFYNPGGPGNSPDANTTYSQPGAEYFQPVTIALDNPMQVSYDPVNGQIW